MNHANILFTSAERPFAVTGVEHFRLSSEAPCISMWLMLPLGSHLEERNNRLARHSSISKDNSFFRYMASLQTSMIFQQVVSS